MITMFFVIYIMKDNNPSNKISSFLTFRNHSSLTISISDDILVLSFILLFALFFGFISINDNTALAFKPTVPSNQGNQQ